MRDQFITVVGVVLQDSDHCMFEVYFLKYFNRFKAELIAVCSFKLQMEWQYVFSMKFHEIIEPYIGQYTLIIGNAYGISSSTFFIEEKGKRKSSRFFFFSP